MVVRKASALGLGALLSMFGCKDGKAAIIDGNPLYMPNVGHFYSVTSAESHSENETLWTLGEQFGYGITNKLAVQISTNASEAHEFDNLSWNDADVAFTFRALDKGAWKLDLIGAYGVDPVWGDHRPFLEEDDTFYTWTAGVRGGYTTAGWTIAGHALFSYENFESFNWNDEGAHIWTLGLDGQLVLDSNWNLVAGIEYKGLSDSWAKNAGRWTAEFGVNYNIDATKFVGVYVSGDMNHRGGTTRDEWETEDGFGFGAKFGIDF